jgi:hypothetical protein
VSNVIENYKTAQENLNKHLGMEMSDYGIDFLLYSTWDFHGSDVGWEENGDRYSGELYGSCKSSKNGFSTFLINNGCGDLTYVVFLDINKVEE